MNSPESDKIVSTSTQFTTTNTTIVSKSPAVQDSPVFCYINNLSPIKPFKPACITQEFHGLNSPPLVFSSPHLNSLETSFQKRSQNTHSSSAEITVNNAERKKSIDGSEDPEKCARQMCGRLITGFQESDNKMFEGTHTCSSSGFVDNYSADHEVNSTHSTHSVIPQLQQSNDVPETLLSASNDIKKTSTELDGRYPSVKAVGMEAEEHLSLSKQAEKSKQLNLAFDANPAKIGKKQMGGEWLSIECHNTMFDLSTKHALKEHQNEDSCTQMHDEGVVHQEGFDFTPESAPETLRISEAFEDCDENAGDFCCGVFQLKQSLPQKPRRVHQRCLQFEDASTNATEDSSHSNNSTSLATNVEYVNQEPSQEKLNATPREQKPFNLSQPRTSLLSPCHSGISSSVVSKPSGIGLHLNSIVTAMPMDHSQIGSMKSAEDYINIQGMTTAIRSSQLSEGRKTCSENASKCGEAEMHESRDMIMVGSLTTESYHAMEPLNLLKPTEFQATPCEKRKCNSEQIDTPEVFHELIPKQKRNKASVANDGGGCKRCNCKKTKCLKLYCDCFAAGIYCSKSCACQGCSNRPEYEDTVLETRRKIESRNPLAFAPMIVQHLSELPLNTVEEGTQSTPSLARHKRGCNCKKSTCLKKYCECYQAGVGCSNGCRCEGCKNVYGRKDGTDFLATAHCVTKDTVSCVTDAGGLEGNSNENLEIAAIRKDFSHAEFYGQHHTPQTPSFQYSDHGMDNPKSKLITKRRLLSLDSDLTIISHPNPSRSHKPSHGNNMLLETNTELLDISSYVWQTTYDNADVLDHSSPGFSAVENLCHLSPLYNHPSAAVAYSAASKTRDWRNISNVQSSSNSLGRIRSLKQLNSEIRVHHNEEDDTPKILKDTTAPSIKVSSPNKKRVSPPHYHTHEHGSSSLEHLRSGRKFILKAVTSFPPLIPCINSIGKTDTNTSDLHDDNSKK